MAAEKLSISIPGPALEFMERYRKTHSIKTRSEVVQEALALLRERELDGAYREANAEIDLDWDRASSDGLTDEAW
jgi:antitoxin ParD1/3/4